MIPIIYYAHSLTMYDTDREQEELKRLEEHFPHGVIYNPNRPYIQTSKDPMKACFQVVDDSWITGLAFSHTHRKISSGVYAEIRIAQKRYKPIYIIEQDRIRQYHGKITMTGKDKATDWAKV